MRRLAVVTIVSLLACGIPTEEQPPDVPETAQSLSVAPELIDKGRIHSSEIAHRPMVREQRLPGYVRASPRGEAMITAGLEGWVREVLVREGDRVAPGQPLARLATPDVARLRGRAAASRARRRAADAIAGQERELVDRGATSQRALVGARRDAEEARAEERALFGQLAAYGNSGSELRSPIAGLVVHRAVVTGQHLAPGQLSFRVVAPDALEVVAGLPLRMRGDVSEGRTVDLHPMGASQPCEGRVVGRGVAVEPGSTRVPLRIAPSRACGELIVDAYVEVRLTCPMGAEKVAAVPRAAVVELDGVPAVFVPDGEPGRFRIQPVEVRHVTARWAYLVDDMKAGTRVVDRGTVLLEGEWMRGALE